MGGRANVSRPFRAAGGRAWREPPRTTIWVVRGDSVAAMMMGSVLLRIRAHTVSHESLTPVFGVPGEALNPSLVH